jgi:saccharopine dehydrogenase-like NADP-dependent oxidoreductase
MVRKFSQQISNKELTISEASIAFFKEAKKIRNEPEVLKEYADLPPGLSVVVTGTKEGKRKKVAIAGNRAPFGAMAGVTGVPLAIGALMILEGKINKKGVFTPEEVINNQDELNHFFDKYAKYCGEGLKSEDVLLKKVIDL